VSVSAIGETPLDLTGIGANVTVFVVMLLLVNLPAARLGIEFDSQPTPGVRFAPPGWLVTIAWLTLMPSLGAARALLLEHPGAGAAANGMLVLGVLIATYAYTTLGIARLTRAPVSVLALVVNSIVVTLALVLASAARAVSAAAAIVLVAVATWTLVASISVIQEVALLRRR
jgi:tryptophan-rich sensory protein